MSVCRASREYGGRDEHCRPRGFAFDTLRPVRWMVVSEIPRKRCAMENVACAPGHKRMSRSGRQRKCGDDRRIYSALRLLMAMAGEINTSVGGTRAAVHS